MAPATQEESLRRVVPGSRPLKRLVGPRLKGGSPPQPPTRTSALCRLGLAEELQRLKRLDGRNGERHRRRHKEHARSQTNSQRDHIKATSGNGVLSNSSSNDA